MCYHEPYGHYAVIGKKIGGLAGVRRIVIIFVANTLDLTVEPTTLKQRIRALFTFSHSHRRALLALLPLMAAAAIIFRFAQRPHLGDAFAAAVDSLIAGDKAVTVSGHAAARHSASIGASLREGPDGGPVRVVARTFLSAGTDRAPDNLPADPHAGAGYSPSVATAATHPYPDIAGDAGSLSGPVVEPHTVSDITAVESAAADPVPGRYPSVAYNRIAGSGADDGRRADPVISRSAAHAAMLSVILKYEPYLTAGTDAVHAAHADGLFVFDPNTASLQDFVALGIDTRTAAGIIKYRTRGKVFEIPEDLATCYGIDLDTYTRLEPYIVISPEFRVSARADRYGSRGSGRGTNTVDHNTSSRSGRGPGQMPGELPEPFVFDPNILDADGYVSLGFSAAQSRVIVNFRESMGGFGNFDDFARCYVVSETMASRLAPYMVFGKASLEDRQACGTTGGGRAAIGGAESDACPVIELNGADSATLRSVSGIGEVLVVRIMDYRRRLGGFTSAAQLAEVQGMTEANFERICRQIYVDTCNISKIDINFADPKILTAHPYLQGRTLRKVLSVRQMKGGWSSIEDMVDGGILTVDQAARLGPYLHFSIP